MQIVAIVSQKGGSGKTTLTINLAVAASDKGSKNIAILDLDPQASATKWGDRREGDLPVVLSVHASRLGKEIERAREAGCELLFIDTAPHSDSAALEAIKHASLVVVPCRPAILDLEAITNTLELVNYKKIPVFVLLNSVAAVGVDGDEAVEAIKELGAEVCPQRLVNRVSFSRSLITGQSVQEIEPKGKAASEIKEVHKFIREQLQVCT